MTRGKGIVMKNMKLELFVNDMPTSVSFYKSVLGFETVLEGADGYTVMKNGEVQIDLQLRSYLGDDHPIKPTAKERMGLGVEIVLELDDIDAAYRRVLEEDWPLSAPFQFRPWGATDFRVLDPDGRYIRITSGDEWAWREG